MKYEDYYDEYATNRTFVEDTKEYKTGKMANADCSETYGINLRKVPRLSEDEEAGLFRRIAMDSEDMDAVNRIVEGNLGLIYKPARKYCFPGVSFDDLISEGSLALINAAKKYDYTRGYKFSTYAVSAIEHQLAKYIAEKCRTIRLPKDVAKKVYAQKRISDDFEKEHGRKPRVAEIAEIAGTTEAEVEKIFDIIEDAVSLDAPYGKEGECTNWDNIDILNYSETVEDTIMKLCDYAEVRKAVAELTDRDKKVIELRFGFKDGICHTYEEIGNELNITRDGVRATEARALRRLKNTLVRNGFAA